MTVRVFESLPQLAIKGSAFQRLVVGFSLPEDLIELAVGGAWLTLRGQRRLRNWNWYRARLEFVAQSRAIPLEVLGGQRRLYV